MEAPSSAPSIPRSGEDLSRAFRNLPPGTLSGLDALCDHVYWLSIMRQAEIEISNEDIFRFRFAEISKTASNRLAFLAGTGEYGSFNLRYLIQQLVEQCADMHKYTRKLEKYVVKLQRQVEELEAQQEQRVSGGGGGGGSGGGGGGGGGRHRERHQQQQQQLEHHAPQGQQGQAGGGGGGGGLTSGGGGGGAGGSGSSAAKGTGSSSSHLTHHLLAYQHPHLQLASLVGPTGQSATHVLGPKRSRSPGSVEAPGSSPVGDQDDE